MAIPMSNNATIFRISFLSTGMKDGSGPYSSLGGIVLANNVGISGRDTSTPTRIQVKRQVLPPVGDGWLRQG
jgi:hypothetical protein